MVRSSVNSNLVIFNRIIISLDIAQELINKKPK